MGFIGDCKEGGGVTVLKVEGCGGKERGYNLILSGGNVVKRDFQREDRLIVLLYIGSYTHIQLVNSWAFRL